MANDHAQDRYDPPKVGSEYEEDKFSEINPGELFRLFASNDAKMYRKSSDNFAFDIKEQVEIQFDSNEKVYVKS
mgnify:FL=1|jgi:hypothetical protein|tara:strand:- start:79 stop:300 length:222 start_codon:yes stop_codon:yes gene_type:complete